MWADIAEHFQRTPAQLAVARTLLTHGFRVAEGRVYSGDVEISDAAIARAADVDRRVVASTVETIVDEPDLRAVFANLRPVAHLKEVAPEMGWSSLEIIVRDAREPGILADVTSIIAGARISIRQAIADDPDLVEDARLFVVTESQVPMELIPEIKAVDGVESVVIH